MRQFLRLSGRRGGLQPGGDAEIYVIARETIPRVKFVYPLGNQREVARLERDNVAQRRAGAESLSLEIAEQGAAARVGANLVVVVPDSAQAEALIQALCDQAFHVQFVARAIVRVFVPAVDDESALAGELQPGLRVDPGQSQL